VWLAKQAFVCCQTIACLGSYIFAEFFFQSREGHFWKLCFVAIAARPVPTYLTGIPASCDEGRIASTRTAPEAFPPRWRWNRLPAVGFGAFAGRELLFTPLSREKRALLARSVPCWRKTVPCWRKAVSCWNASAFPIPERTRDDDPTSQAQAQ
jgi:hypothetical protein